MRSLLLVCLITGCMAGWVGSAGAEQAAPPALDSKITIDLRQVPLRAALEELFRYRGLVVAVEPDVPNDPVTLHLEGVPFSAALGALTSLANIPYRKLSDLTYVIGHPAGAGVPGAAEQREPHFTFDLRHVPFHRVLADLFGVMGRKYLVTPQAPNPQINMNLRDVEFSTALRTLCRLAGATYARDGSFYIIDRRAPPPPPPSGTKITRILEFHP
jgi:hypothetical protein